MADRELERQFLLEFLRWKLDELEDYAETFEASLADEQKKLADDVRTKTAAMSDEEKTQLDGYYSFDVSKLSETFPYLLRSGFLVSCYSMLENELMVLCAYVQTRHHFSISPKDLRGNGIVLCQDYLKKVAKVSFRDQSSSWREILFFNQIRNQIVHTGGVVAVEEKKLREAIEKSTHMNLSSQNIIQLSETSGTHVVATIRQFFEELFSAFEHDLTIRAIKNEP